MHFLCILRGGMCRKTEKIVEAGMRINEHNLDSLRKIVRDLQRKS